MSKVTGLPFKIKEATLTGDQVELAIDAFRKVTEAEEKLELYTQKMDTFFKILAASGIKFRRDFDSIISEPGRLRVYSTAGMGRDDGDQIIIG